MSVKKKRPTKAEAAPEEPTKSLSFETAIQRLGVIVEQLESGDMPLEDSLKLFEEGIRLARGSQGQLDAAEKRIEKLLSIDESGQPVVEELDVPESS